MLHSLKLRLALVVSISLLLVSSAVAFVLERAFSTSLQKQLQSKMQTQVYMLLTATEEEQPGQIYIPEVVREDIFNQIESGTYAFAFSAQGEESWRSFSAVDFIGESYFNTPAGEFVFEKRVIAEKEFFRLGYSIIWESEDGSEHAYQFVILHEADILYAIIQEFRVTLWGWMGFVFLAMFLIQLVALMWGFKPLGKIAHDLVNIEEGHQKTLSDNYPVELKPLTHNLNLLIESERLQREKYRQTLSNLAHSLKTPLAVLKGAVGNYSEQQKLEQLLEQQVTRMNEIVQYQLHRAVVGQQGHMLASVNVSAAAEKIVAALQKVYLDKGLSIQCSLDAAARFYGDEGDLMEMLGNLLDNACKWANTRVVVQITSAQVERALNLMISVQDDGPGVPVNKRENILQRGKRLDEQVEGQGIGLSVVNELVFQYGGSIQIKDSELGGACFLLTFNFDRSHS